MGSKKSRGKSKSKKSSKTKICKKKKHSRVKKNKKTERESSEKSDRTSGSRSCNVEEYFSQIRNFSRVREDYFKYLQAVVTDNCALFGFDVTKEMLEHFALELEKDALLACLQIDIYTKFMSRIISDIEKCTKAEQIHEEVKKLLLESTQEEISPPKTDSQPSETYFRIPTISSSRSDENRNFSEYKWTEESAYMSDTHPADYYRETYSENYNNSEVGPEVNQFWNNVLVTSEDNVEPIVTESEVHSDLLSDPLLVSRNQLQKSVEETLKQNEEISKQKKDELERAYIEQILEGDDSLDDRLNDSLSDNENESKENIDESNLMDRLEKMREIFGMESNDDVITVEEKEKPKKVKRIRRSNIWKHEKVIQQHKYALIASEMTSERRDINRRMFQTLFGFDSDEEHEWEYISEERYRSNCVERISSWVVKYLMPFYHQKKVIGRDVFKALGHRISNSIIDEIQYPDEWTVKYFVSKFFPSKKKYVCTADILAFQLD